MWRSMSKATLLDVLKIILSEKLSNVSYCKNAYKIVDHTDASHTVNPVLSDHTLDQKWGLKPDNHLMQVKSIAECSRSILQYFLTCTKLPLV